MAITELDDIIKSINSLGAQQSLDASQPFLIQLKVTVSTYLKKVNQVLKNFEKEKAAVVATDSETRDTWTAIRNTVGLTSEIFQEGVLLAEKIREIFTKQTIDYTVVVPYYGSVYIKKMKLEEFIRYSGLGVDWQTQQLKLKITKGKYALLGLQEAGERIVVEGENLEKLSPDEQYVFNQLMTARESFGANRGHVSEAFIAWKRGGKKPKTLTRKGIESRLQKVKENTTKGLQSGDVGLEQVKSFNASLESLKSIIDTLTNILAALESKSKKELEEVLIRSFTNSKAKGSLEKSIKTEAEKNIKQMLNTLSQYANISVSSV